MTRKDLKIIIKTAGLFNECCAERESETAFNLSKQCAVNEVDDPKTTLNMYFVEFLEAFARIAEESSL